MRIQIISYRRLKHGMLLGVCLAAGVLLFSFPEATQNGIRHGLAVCGQLLIPSLFPFLVLSGFLIRSGIVHSIGNRLQSLSARLLHLSGCAATAVIISMIGGYPAGAAAVVTMLEQGDIDREEGERLFRCCVNAGPAFIIGGVGVGMLGCAKAGALLLIAHLTASVVVILLDRSAHKSPPRAHRISTVSVGTAVVDSVHHASQSLIAMCGFVLLASCLLSLEEASGLATLLPSEWQCVIACTVEVSTGCMQAVSTGKAAPFWLGAALGFGGLSVHGQIASRINGYGRLTTRFFCMRLLHALLGGCLSFILFWLFHPQPHAVSAMRSALSAFADHNNTVGISGLIALLTMCALFLYTLPRRTPTLADE